MTTGNTLGPLAQRSDIESFCGQKEKGTHHSCAVTGETETKQGQYAKTKTEEKKKTKTEAKEEAKTKTEEKKKTKTEAKEEAKTKTKSEKGGTPHSCAVTGEAETKTKADKDEGKGKDKDPSVS